MWLLSQCPRCSWMWPKRCTSQVTNHAAVSPWHELDVFFWETNRKKWNQSVFVPGTPELNQFLDKFVQPSIPVWLYIFIYYIIKYDFYKKNRQKLASWRSKGLGFGAVDSAQQLMARAPVSATSPKVQRAEKTPNSWEKSCHEWRFFFKYYISRSNLRGYNILYIQYCNIYINIYIDCAFEKTSIALSRFPRFDESFEFVEGFRIYDLSFEDSLIKFPFSHVITRKQSQDLKPTNCGGTYEIYEGHDLLESIWIR